jgi:predicted extracellular nuclease
MAPNSTHLPAAANDIAVHLRTPDIMFMQEIQDNSGPTDDGTVDASVTLATLAAAIAGQSAVNYSFTEVIPVNDQDGGEIGGNIRPAYL